MANVHIDLTEDGLPGQWMDVADLGTFSPSDFEELTRGGDAETARSFVAAVVVAWHIVRKDGVELPAPSSPDLDLSRVPSRVTSRLGAEVTRQIEDIRSPKVSS